MDGVGSLLICDGGFFFLMLGRRCFGLGWTPDSGSDSVSGLGGLWNIFFGLFITINEVSCQFTCNSTNFGIVKLSSSSEAHLKPDQMFRMDQSQEC